MGALIRGAGLRSKWQTEALQLAEMAGWCACWRTEMLSVKYEHQVVSC